MDVSKYLFERVPTVFSIFLGNEGGGYKVLGVNILILRWLQESQ